MSLGGESITAAVALNLQPKGMAFGMSVDICHTLSRCDVNSELIDRLEKPRLDKRRSYSRKYLKMNHYKTALDSYKQP